MFIKNNLRLVYEIVISVILFLLIRYRCDFLLKITFCYILMSLE